MAETQTPAATMPLFYQEPVAINADQHRNLTVAPSPKGYGFATTAHTVLLNAVEFYEACREYPIIFSLTPEGDFAPLALLGLQQGENLFIDAAGVWQATYIPAYVRRYPFIAADTGTETFPVCIDQSYDGLNIEGGQRIFDESGQPTDYCRHIQAFVTDYQQQHVLTRTFTAKLKELELFQSHDANVQLNDGRKFSVQGLFSIDENRLARLGDVNVLDLFRKGYLGLIYAHLASIKNLQKLVNLKAA